MQQVVSLVPTATPFLRRSTLTLAVFSAWIALASAPSLAADTPPAAPPVKKAAPANPANPATKAAPAAKSPVRAQPASPEAPAAKDSKAASDPSADKPLPPVTELTADILLKTMLYEIADARDQKEWAAYLALDVARVTRDPRLAKRATEIAWGAKQFGVAGEAAKLWYSLEKDPKNSLQALGLLLSGENAKLEDLEPSIRRLLDSETMPIESMLLQLPTLFGRHPDHAGALAVVERLTKPHRKYAESHMAIAVMAVQAGDNAKAERESQLALDIRPDWEPAARMRAQAAPEARRKAAMEELGQFGKHYPQARAAREDYARWLSTEGRTVESAQAFERLQADFPDDDDVVFGNVVVMLQNGQDAKTEPLLRRLIDHKYGETNVLRRQLGMVLERGGRKLEAIEMYRSVAPGKEFAAAQIRAAQLQSEAGQREQAIAALDAAIARSPADQSDLTLAQAVFLQQGKQTAAALALLEKLLATRPDDHELLYQSAMLAEQLGRLPQMETWLRHLIQVRPDQSSAFNALGYSFADRNVRLDEADALLTQAIKLSPDEAAIIDSMGWLRFRQGRLAEAQSYLEKAYAKQPDAEVAAHLVEVLWVGGRKEEARKLLQEASAKHADNAALNEVRDRLMK